MPFEAEHTDLLPALMIFTHWHKRTHFSSQIISDLRMARNTDSEPLRGTGRRCAAAQRGLTCQALTQTVSHLVSPAAARALTRSTLTDICTKTLRSEAEIWCLCLYYKGARSLHKSNSCLLRRYGGISIMTFVFSLHLQNHTNQGGGD